MRRLTGLLAIFGALAVAACSGGMTGTQGVEGEPRLTPQQRARAAAFIQTYGTPKSVALLSVAINNLRRQNYGSAIQAATFAIESGELTPRGQSLGYSIRATAYGLTNRRNLARADIQQALLVDPRNVMALNARAGEALLAGRLTEADRDYSRSIAIRPTGRAHFGRAFIRLYRRQFAAALSDANQSIAIEPRPASAYALRGLIQHAMGRNTAARQSFRMALDRNPRSALAEAGLRALNAGRAPYRPRQYRRQKPGGREGSI